MPRWIGRSRRERELELQVRSRLSCRVNGTADRLVADGSCGSEGRSPFVFERGPDLKRVALPSSFAATLSDDFSTDARRMLDRVAKRNRGASTRPHVLATEVVVGEKLRVERTLARATVVRTEARRCTCRAATLGSGRAGVFIVDERVPAAELAAVVRPATIASAMSAFLHVFSLIVLL